LRMIASFIQCIKTGLNRNNSFIQTWIALNNI